MALAKFLILRRPPTDPPFGRSEDRLRGRLEGRPASIRRVLDSLTRPQAEKGAAKAFLNLLRDERGVTAVLVAVTLPVLLLFGALAIDTGWWFATKRQMQSAADAAALSAAYEVMAGSSNLVQAASDAAKQNNYAGPALTATCSGGGPLVCSSYSDTYFSGVEVILNQPVNSTLASWALPSGVTIATRAVAVKNPLPLPYRYSCVLALGLNPPPTGNATEDNAINLAGTINAPDCSLVSDSDSTSAFQVQGSATINAATLITPGQVSFTGGAYTLNLSYPAQTGANIVPDPYANMLTHTFLTTGPPAMPTAPACMYNNTTSTWSGNCVVAGSSINVGDTLSANTQISGGLAIKNGTVNLSLGTYWITDGNLDLQNGSSRATLQCPSCTNGGAGVTVILTTAQVSGGTVGAVTLGSNANLNLNAPSSGTFKGLVLIQDSNGLPAAPSNAQANATETLTGLVYFPQSAITFQGTPAATGPQCLVLVANTVAMQGNPAFDTSGCGSLGLNNMPIIYAVALAE